MMFGAAVLFAMLAAGSQASPAPGVVAAPGPTATAPAALTGDLNLSQVLERVKAANGTRPHDEKIVTTFVRHGLTGTDVRLRSGDDYRVDSTLGPLHDAYGSVGGVSWIQNENGETVLDSETADEPAEEETITKATHVREGGDFYVVSDLTLLGYGTKEYYDPATWHEVKFESIEPTATQTTIYGDFHTTAGYTRAWHRSVSDGHKENDADYTITSVDASAIPATQLAVPPPSRKLVEFPAGVASVVLPARLDDRGEKFIVRLMVGGRGLDFLLDTGASGIVIDGDVAKSMGLKEYGAFSSGVNAGRYVGTHAIIPTIGIGTLTMRDVVVDTVPPGLDDGEDYKVVGLLGFDFLEAIGAKIDYEHGTVTAYDPSAFVPPTTPRTVDLDVRLGSGQPETDVSVNGEVGTRFILDTGGAGAVIINDYFRRRYPHAVVDEDRRKNEPMTLEGVGGEFQVERVKIAALQLGNVKFTSYYALVMTSAKLYSTDQDGLIGPDLFRLFTLYLDYQHEKVYLSPSDVANRVITP